MFGTLKNFASNCAARSLLVLALVGFAVVSLDATPAHADPGTRTAVTPGGYVPTSVTRILDTRISLGAAVAKPKTVTAVTVLGKGQVPTSGVAAVVVNVTATAPTAAGYLTVFAAGAARPTTSNLNFGARQTVPGLVVTRIGTDGKIALYNGSTGTVQLVADVAGYYLSGSPTAGGFTPTTPTRVLDTRANVGAHTPAAGVTIHPAILGRGGVPAGNVSAVMINVTVTGAGKGGFVTVWGEGARPTASNLNFPAGRTIANLVVAPVAADGTISLYNGTAGSTPLIGDVAGYFAGDTATSPGAFVSTAPTRLLDTRVGLGGRTPGRNSRVVLPVLGRGPVPSLQVAAVVLNVTVVNPAAAGYVTAYPGRAGRPTSSNLNFAAHQTVPNLVIAPVGADGTVQMYNGSTGSAPLVADVAGYVLDARTTTTSTAPKTVAARTDSMTAISCAAATFCVAVDDFGNTVTWDGTTWSAPRRIDSAQDDPQRLYLEDVSCPTRQFCAAAESTALRTYDGVSWSAEQQIGSAAGEILGVSCASATFCIAVTAKGMATRFDGHSWSTPESAAGSNYLGAVSCVSASFCLATGSDTHVIVRFDGTSWASVASPTDLSFGRSISCATTTFCVAVNGGRAAFLYDGASWRVTDLHAYGLESVSCTATTNCVALDAGRGSFTFDGDGWTSSPFTNATGMHDIACSGAAFCMSISYDSAIATADSGATWSDPRLIDGPNYLADLACSSRSACMAVAGRYSYRFDGSGWTQDTLPRAGSGAVDCPAASFCAAVGGTQLVTWDGARWTASGDLRVPSPFGTFVDVSCDSVTSCMAVVDDYSGNGTATSFYSVWNGTAWSAARSVAVGPHVDISGIACTGGLRCQAVARNLDNISDPIALTFAAGAWRVVGAAGAAGRVVCVGATFCVTADESGDVSTFDGHAWTASYQALTPDSQHETYGLACAADFTCVLTDTDGTVSVYDGTSWGIAQPVESGLGLAAVSCPEPGLCLVISNGNQWRTLVRG